MPPTTDDIQKIRRALNVLPFAMAIDVPDTNQIGDADSLIKWLAAYGENLRTAFAVEQEAYQERYDALNRAVQTFLDRDDEVTRTIALHKEALDHLRDRTRSANNAPASQE